MIKKTNH